MGRTLSLDFKLLDHQIELVESKFKYTGLVSGIGGGKTFSGAVKATVTGTNTPGMGLIVSPTYGMLSDSTLRMFREVAGETIAAYNKSEKVGRFVNGNEFLCRSADDPEHLRGPNIAWVWIDEAQLVSEEAWHIIEGRLRRGVRQAWATFTPNGKLHWTYNVFGKNDRTHKLIQARTKDNIFLPQDYVDALYASYTGNYAQQELEGKFVDPEGALFHADWFRLVQPRELPKGLQWIRAWDLALTEEDAGDSKKMKKPDRTASVRVAVDQLGNIYIDAGVAWRREWPETRKEMISMAKQERNPIIIEAVAFQKAAVQEMLREPELMGIEVVGYVPGSEIKSQYQMAFADRNPRRDKDRTKVDRARVWQARAANRQIYMVDSEWNIKQPGEERSMLEDCVLEICDFRADMSHRHDDWVDAISIAMKHLRMPVLYEALKFSAKPTGLAFDKAFNKPSLSQSNIVVI